jgi:hypothetical protein
MLIGLAIFLAVITLFFTIILLALLSISWFGLNKKIKHYINKYLSKSFDQSYQNI